MTATLRLNLSRTIAILIFIASAVYLIHPAFAIDATPSTTRREKIGERIETRKENVEAKIANIREKMASREATMKVRLEAFKDKRKAQIAEKINTNLNKVNQNQTALMQKHLDAMTTLLNKVETRVNQATPDIKDPAGAKVAIADARTKIASASTAVQTQGEKDYTITITSEAKVGADAKIKREELYKDIMALRKQIIDAKQAVSNSIRVAKGGTTMREGTSSGQQ